VILAMQSKLRNWIISLTPNAKHIILKQNSLYIIPTKVFVAFLVTIIILALTAINYQNNLVYVLSFILIAMFLNMMIFTHRNLEKINITNMGCNEVFVGDKCAFKIKIKVAKTNRYAIKIYFYKQPNDYVLLDVTPNCEQVISLLYPAAKRGFLIPPKIKVETRFPLGLFVCWGYFDLNFKALVYPKPLKTALNFAQHGSNANQENSINTNNIGVDDFLGLDNYQPGDSKRRLDWKAYSRGQGLLVKKFGELGGSQIDLDFSKLQGDVETRLSALCYLVLELTKQNLSFSLKLPQREIAINSGLKHEQACLTALALHNI